MRQRSTGSYAPSAATIEVPRVHLAPAGHAAHPSLRSFRLNSPGGHSVHTPSICSRPAPQRHLASACSLWQTADGATARRPFTSSVTLCFSKSLKKACAPTTQAIDRCGSSTVRFPHACAPTRTDHAWGESAPQARSDAPKLLPLIVSVTSPAGGEPRSTCPGLTDSMTGSRYRKIPWRRVPRPMDVASTCRAPGAPSGVRQSHVVSEMYAVLSQGTPSMRSIGSEVSRR